MGTRKLMDCVDNSTKEKVYPITHAQAVYTNDGMTLQDKLDDEAYVSEAQVQEMIKGKQDSIEDLDTIREGASKGATAIQQHQDISGKLDKAGGLVANVSIACDAEGNNSDSYVNEIDNYAATLRLQKSSSQALALCQGGGKTRVYGPFEADKPAEFKDSLKAKSFINSEGVDITNIYATKDELHNVIGDINSILDEINGEVI